MNYITKDSTEYLAMRFDNFMEYIDTRPTGKPKPELKDLVTETETNDTTKKGA